MLSCFGFWFSRGEKSWEIVSRDFFILGVGWVGIVLVLYRLLGF